MELGFQEIYLFIFKMKPKLMCFHFYKIPEKARFGAHFGKEL